MKSVPGSPVDRLLTASLIVAPVLYLVADVLYTLSGWADPTAAVFHILGATFYTFVLLRVLTWTGGTFAAVLLVVGVLGTAGNVAYGFNTIHVSLGDTDLVDATGAAELIKPLGLFFPLTLLLIALGLRGLRAAWIVVLLAAAAVAWPIAHIANIGWLAVVVNVGLVIAFGAIAANAAQTQHAPQLAAEH